MSFGRVREGFRPQIRADGLTKATRGGVVVPCRHKLRPTPFTTAYLITTYRKLKKSCLCDRGNLMCPLCTGSVLLFAAKSRVADEYKPLDCSQLKIESANFPTEIWGACWCLHVIWNWVKKLKFAWTLLQQYIQIIWSVPSSILNKLFSDCSQIKGNFSQSQKWHCTSLRDSSYNNNNGINY